MLLRMTPTVGCAMMVGTCCVVINVLESFISNALDSIDLLMMKIMSGSVQYVK